ncbi:ribonuclease P protein subunit p29 [Rhizoctonia solani AG-3 Rhs1AP]|uniref:Ribonuclease P protein subunit p29 n=1 Tax=Rhizoctonia solani AG-3 Rhs1AP TaxID=1086054 RepID=X8JMC6_9AGAM|nr:ribonuclease P protein subunit p29 [Rhizoctonia solani AG-3 Rhs1AP]
MASEAADIYRSNTGAGASGAAVDTVIDILGEVIGRSEAESVYTTRAKGRPMILDNPQKESKSRLEQKNRATRRKEDKRRRRQNIEHGKERLTPKIMVKGLKYSTFVDIHKLWCGYMSELLSLSALALINEPLEAYLSSHAIGMQTKLVKADFHGCKLTVKASKCPTLIGSSGLVIEETSNVFRIITIDDRVKVLPKQNSIFTFTVPLKADQGEASPQIQFELYGNQFRYRAEDRASRKFKSKETIEL